MVRFNVYFTTGFELGLPFFFEKCWVLNLDIPRRGESCGTFKMYAESSVYGCVNLAGERFLQFLNNQWLEESSSFGAENLVGLLPLRVNGCKVLVAVGIAFLASVFSSTARGVDYLLRGQAGAQNSWHSACPKNQLASRNSHTVHTCFTGKQPKHNAFLFYWISETWTALDMYQLYSV